MVRLIISRRYPFVSLSDVALRRQVERLQKENEDLRARVVGAHQEKAVALKQADELRKEKERLRLKVVSMKQSAESQRKVQEVQQAKIQALREENELLKQ